MSTFDQDGRTNTHTLIKFPKDVTIQMDDKFFLAGLADSRITGTSGSKRLEFELTFRAYVTIEGTSIRVEWEDNDS